jgi:ADP-heptose:LPS heptosyltransferase
MHCAAALGVKTMGLFGPSYPEIYAPWGAHTAFARTPESFDELIDFAGYDPKTLQKTLMASLSVGVVEAAVHQHLQKLMVNEIAAE